MIRKFKRWLIKLVLNYVRSELVIILVKDNGWTWSKTNTVLTALRQPRVIKYETHEKGIRIYYEPKKRKQNK